MPSSKAEKKKRAQRAAELRHQKELLDTLADLRDKGWQAYKDWQTGDRELRQAKADVERLTRDVPFLWQVSEQARIRRESARDDYVFFSLNIRKK